MGKCGWLVISSRVVGECGVVLLGMSDRRIGWLGRISKMPYAQIRELPPAGLRGGNASLQLGTSP
jgi:hypothetical protein